MDANRRVWARIGMNGMNNCSEEIDSFYYYAIGYITFILITKGFTLRLYIPALQAWAKAPKGRNTPAPGEVRCDTLRGPQYMAGLLN
jgi:hypothetical protein